MACTLVGVELLQRDHYVPGIVCTHRTITAFRRVGNDDDASRTPKSVQTFVSSFAFVLPFPHIFIAPPNHVIFTEQILRSV